MLAGIDTKTVNSEVFKDGYVVNNKPLRGPAVFFLNEGPSL